MIPYAAYKIVHYLGIFIVVTALGAALARAAMRDGTYTEPDPWARRLVAAHGVALFLILLGGFGMLARLEITQGLALPGWIWVKLLIWFVLGGILGARRRPAGASKALILIPILAALAGWVALAKPF